MHEWNFQNHPTLPPGKYRTNYFYLFFFNKKVEVKTLAKKEAYGLR